mgnify:CR=1 FL=1
MPGFDERLALLRQEIVTQGRRVLDLCTRAVDCFFDDDADKARGVQAGDDDIDYEGLKAYLTGKFAQAEGIRYAYLEYGSYLSQWRRRLALKMWTGWPTFPMVFVKGTFVGGADDLARLQSTGELTRLLG